MLGQRVRPPHATRSPVPRHVTGTMAHVPITPARSTPGATVAARHRATVPVYGHIITRHQDLPAAAANKRRQGRDAAWPAWAGLARSGTERRPVEVAPCRWAGGRAPARQRRRNALRDRQKIRHDRARRRSHRPGGGRPSVGVRRVGELPQLNRRASAAWRSAGLPAVPIRVGRNDMTGLSGVIYESGHGLAAPRPR